MQQKYYTPAKFTDLENKRFDKLTAIRFLDFRETIHRGKYAGKKEAFWLVRCDCGKEREVPRSRLISGGLSNCGCNTGHLMRKAYGKTIGELSGSIWNRIKENARSRQIPITITQLEAEALFRRQNKRCTLSGEPISLDYYKSKTEVTASLDRIDSSKGYEVGNVQWVHKVVNQMKNNMPEPDFLCWVKLIANFK